MLEASGQIVLLEPWFSNRAKSIVKSPKLYLADTGLLCSLLNVRSEEISVDPRGRAPCGNPIGLGFSALPIVDLV